LNQFWALGGSIDDLSRIAETLGSDVPFFLGGPSSICTGRGQIVQPIAPPAARWAALFLPGFAVKTAEVYRRFDQLGLGNLAFDDSQPDWRQWAALSAGPLLPRLTNDLEAAAFDLYPELREMHDALEASLGRVIRMSGSGSTLFTLFDARAEAEAAAASALQRHGIAAHAVEVAPGIVDDLGQFVAPM
jgi:4-diphosphocytidyl-2-C-methyl-D-erythritol kinase